MALNQIQLFFGPTMPLEFESVGLSFMTAPTLSSNSAIGSLSAARYVSQNYDHIEPQLGVFNTGAPGSVLDITYNCPPIGAFPNPNSLGLTSTQSNIVLVDQNWGPQILNNSLLVSGIKTTQAGTWCPVIQPGLVWREGYLLASSGIEPSGSWLRRAIPDDGNDYYLTLIYSVPEMLYPPTQDGYFGLTFPPPYARFQTIKETGNPVSPQTISYQGNLDVLLQVVVNGVTTFASTYTGVEDYAYLSFLNKNLKQIGITSSLNPNDLVELTYLSYDDFYVYSGFRDVNNNWWPFDANPEYGHIIGDDQSGTYIMSSDALIQQITLYAIPSAFIEYRFIPNAATATTIGTLQMTAYRAIDYGETHCIRHIISSEPIEDLVTRDGGTVINTWGYAVFGRNYYDEQNQFGGDIFNLNVPSMIPLGRLVMGAPASFNSVATVDMRSRGGGVPLDFPMIAVDSQTNGLDQLRGFYDLGIWNGKAIKEGGVVEVNIDISLLKTDPNDMDPTTFLATEIWQLVRNQIPNGIDFNIVYVNGEIANTLSSNVLVQTHNPTVNT